MLRVNENMVEGTDSALKTFQTSQDSRLLYLSPGKFVLDVNGCHIKYICTIYNRQKVHSTDNIQTITDMSAIQPLISLSLCPEFRRFTDRGMKEFFIPIQVSFLVLKWSPVVST